MPTSYIQGETIAITLADAGYSAVSIKIGTTTHTLAKSGSVWSVSVDSTTLCGSYRWAIFADGKAVETGSLYVKPLVSKYRKVVEEIDDALRNHTESGLYSVSVEGLTMQNLSFDEMLKARNYYERMANAEETGGPARGPTRISEVYA